MKQLLNVDDPIIEKLIEQYGEIVWRQPSNLLEELVDSIISQQLSGKASDTIFNRFKNLYGKKFPTPKKILETPDETLRSVGLSFAKAKYIKSLAQHIVDKDIDLGNLKNLSDEEIITELTKVKGIGRWTAEMILIFTLRRPDIFSVGDLGLRKAVSKLYGVDINDVKKIEKISLKWKPNRSIVCRYLWMSLDGG